MSAKNAKTSSRASGGVLVVGTTPDYVLRLHNQYSGSLLFVVDSRFKGHPLLHPVPPSSLLFTPLGNTEETCSKTVRFISLNRFFPKGVACFDCESLLVASHLASRLQIKFPSWQAIARSRNKFESKKAWSTVSIASPTAILTSDPDHTLGFYRNHGENIVLKPVSGSGSELLFHCKSEQEVKNAVALMEEELPRRRANPLFQPFRHPVHDSDIDPCESWVVEEFIPGQEFSSDFTLRDEEVTLIRETGKIKAVNRSFGSVLAYTFPPRYPEGFSKEALKKVLLKAVNSLGFDWGYFMVDYILRDGFPVILEITPRPGGDSIPDLIRTATRKDVLGLYLDFVRGEFPSPWKEEATLPPESFASINLFAPKEGTLLQLDGSKITSLSHVRGLTFKKAAGDQIVLPPKDYDNRLLGYCIVSLEPPLDIYSECERLEKLLTVSIRDS